MTTHLSVLNPIKITSSIIGAGTNVAEPAPGEVLWISGAAYAVGDLRIRPTTHRVYACVQAHSARNSLPENDPQYWLDKSPTQRFAPFDVYTSTATATAGPIIFVLNPGFFNAVSIYGLSGSSISVSVKDNPGGTVIFSQTSDLSEAPLGWYEYLFLPPKIIEKIIIQDIPIRPFAELTITISGANAAVGMINVGDFVSLLSGAEFGGPQYGATSEPISYSYIKTNNDGTTSIVKRNAATSMRSSIILPAANADYALQVIRGVLDLPVSWVVNEPGFDGLNVFGLGSAVLSYDNHGTAKIDLTVKGFI